MHLDAFFPNVVHEYLYWYGPHTRPRDDRRYMDIIETLGSESVMTTPCVMHLLNRACQCLEDDEVYLEIGTYRGSTMIGALIDNHAKAIVVDDRSEPPHPDGKVDQEEWERNVRVFGMQDRAYCLSMTYTEFYIGAFPNAFTHEPVRAGVAFLDGFSQSAEETYQMIVGVLPFLSEHALIVLDDGNMPKMHDGAHAFVNDYSENAQLLLDIRTPVHKYPTFWNGTIVIAWRSNARYPV